MSTIDLDDPPSVREVDVGDVSPGRVSRDPTVLHVYVQTGVDPVDGYTRECFEAGFRRDIPAVSFTSNLKRLVDDIRRYNVSTETNVVSVPLTNGAAREAAAHIQPRFDFVKRDLNLCRALTYEEIVAADLLPVDDLPFRQRIQALFGHWFPRL